MTKTEFDVLLRSKLSGLTEGDVENAVEYYNEMIDDRCENGEDEEAAVAALGDIDCIIDDYLADTSLAKLIKTRVKKKRRLKTFETVLLILGSPVWLSLIIAAAACIITVYAVLWTVTAVLFAVTLALAVSSVALIIIAVSLAIKSGFTLALLPFGASLLAAGLAILFLLAAVGTVKANVFFGRKIMLGIKHAVMGKENDR